MTSDTGITMSSAVMGLMRFFRDCVPHRITWGIVFRTEFTEDGIRRLDNIIIKLRKNEKLAQTFLDHHNPSDLERKMVIIFQESTGDYIADTIAHRGYIRQCLDEERSIEDRVQAYEQAATFVPPLRQDEQSQFPF